MIDNRQINGKIERMMGKRRRIVIIMVKLLINEIKIITIMVIQVAATVMSALLVFTSRL